MSNLGHDRLFKELLSNFFWEFLELFAPEIAAQSDRASLRFLDKEVFTDVTTGDRHEADLVALLQWRGRETCFLVHVENQASRQADFGERMFRYFARLHEAHRLPVYPMVVFSYEKPRKAEPGSFEVAFPHFKVLEFNFHVVQLNRLSWRDYARHKNPVASALMARMKMEPHERARVKMECLRLLVTLRLNRAKMQLISGFVDSYLVLSETEQEEFLRALRREPQGQRKKVMELMGNWMEEGLRKGVQQGMQKGESGLVLRQLALRVGPLTRRMEKQVGGLPIEKIENLGEALLDFEKRADLDSWLKENA